LLKINYVAKIFFYSYLFLIIYCLLINYLSSTTHSLIKFIGDYFLVYMMNTDDLKPKDLNYCTISRQSL